MGCLFSCFQDKQMYENLELSRSLIDIPQTNEHYYSSEEDFEYLPSFGIVYRRRIYIGDQCI